MIKECDANTRIIESTKVRIIRLGYFSFLEKGGTEGCLYRFGRQGMVEAFVGTLMKATPVGLPSTFPASATL